MTLKEKIAKKAARAAALATYKAILNPPVWKVAGTSFKTSPTWEDIAKAAAAASYGAVLKIAQQQPKNDSTPGIDLGKAPKPFEAPVPNPKKDPVFGKDIGSAEDVDSAAFSMDIPADVKPDMMSIGVALNREAPLFARYIRAGAPSENVPSDAKNFIDYVKGGVPKEAGETWVKPGNLGVVLEELLSNVDPDIKGALKSYLMSL
jgi:hypothetical protein